MSAPSALKPAYQRVMLKLSGEAFHNARTGESLDPDVLESVSRQIKRVRDLGVQVAVIL